MGNPARQKGWMSRHGHLLTNADAKGIMRCPESGFRYQEYIQGKMRCLDLDEEAPLTQNLAMGNKTYAELKRQ